MTDLDKLLQMASTDNISDELLAAYIDGNTTAEENEMIKASIPIADINDIAELSQDSLSFEEQLHFYDGDYGYLELSIPPVLNINDYQNNSNMNERVNYGYKPNYELDKFDPNIFQGAGNTCAIRAQEIILRDYGVMIPQENLVNYATQQGWFDPAPNGGTSKESTGNILEACGLEVSRTEHATIYDLVAELRAGHRVMVSVDSNELWIKNEPHLFQRIFGETKNFINDSVQNFLGIEGADHALIVAGTHINPYNPSDIRVTLIDSGTGQVCIDYSFKDFYDAWKDGNCLMISTKEPAPYQYNYHTHQMEPSGFYTEFDSSKLEIPEGLTNSFELASSYYQDFHDVVPLYDDMNTINLGNDFYDSGEGYQMHLDDSYYDNTIISDSGHQDLDSTTTGFDNMSAL